MKQVHWKLMIDPIKQRFYGIFKLACLCFSLILVLVGTGWAGIDAGKIIEDLRSPNYSVRRAAEIYLVGLGHEAVPLLMAALQNTSNPPEMRASAVKVFWEIDPKVPVSNRDLSRVLKDPSQDIRFRVAALQALLEVKSKSSDLVDFFVDELHDGDIIVRRVAARGLGRIGPAAKSAVPALIEAAKDSDANTREAAISSLEATGAEANMAVPALVEALTDDSASVRAAAAKVLAGIGPDAGTAVSLLINALKDREPLVRRNSARALGAIGLGAKAAISPLMEALNDQEGEVRRAAAISLSDMAVSLQNAKASDSIDQLSNALKALRSQSDPEMQKSADAVERAVEDLKFAQRSKLWPQLIGFVKDYPGQTILIAVPSLVVFVWFALLFNRPLLLLRIGEALRSRISIRLPGIAAIEFPIGRLFIPAFLHYHPRVLDAWVEARIDSAMESFERLDTVRSRSVWVPLPVILNGAHVSKLSGKDLRVIFAEKRGCLLIHGEGGSGKTSLACQIARWAMWYSRDDRFSEHPMIPVLIEQDLDEREVEGKQLLSEIRGRLQVMIGDTDPISEELLEYLLRRRRILVIVDDLSEMSENTRRKLSPALPDFPVHALIVTSRTEESLEGVPKTSIETMRIAANRLSAFLDDYLEALGKRDLFYDEEFFGALQNLSRTVSGRDITVLFATLYAEQMIASKRDPGGGELPESLPELMLSYLNVLNRGTRENKLDDRTVHHAAKVIAWECLKSSYRSTASQRQDVLSALAGVDDPEVLINYLERRLGVIQTIGAGRNRIRFALDPLAEYLAGLHLVETYGGDEISWREFLARADDMPGAPEAIKGFLLALRDCVLVEGAEAKVPEFVADELGRLAGLDPTFAKEVRLELRIRRLIASLNVPDAEVRAAAITALGNIGEEAKNAVPALIEGLRDESWVVRQAAAVSLQRVDPRTTAAADTLIEVEQAREQMNSLIELPEGPFERPGIRLVHRLKRATGMSGDFYGWKPRGGGSLGVYLVDVEGHGLRAAQQAQAVKQALSRSGSEWGTGEARQQLELADAMISEELGAQNIAVTMNFTEIDPQRMIVRHANAGMPFPCLFRSGQAQPEILQAAGVYVGAGYGRYPVKPERVEVSVSDGDILILCSDGIIEAKDARGRLFGQQGIVAAVARTSLESPETIADEILQATAEHAGKKDPDDDQTLIVIQIGKPAEGIRLAGAKTLEKIEGITDAVEYSLMNAGNTGFASHEYLRKGIKSWAQSHGYSDARARQIWVAAWEAIQNAVKHGSRRGDVIHIRLRVAAEGTLQVELVQPQVWRDWDAELGEQTKAMILNSPEPPLGGTVVMLKLADRISVSNQGRKIVMYFSRETSATS